MRYPYVRALIAVGIGCDVYLSGVPHVTPKIIHEFMFQPKTNNTLFDDMLDMFLNQYKKIIS